MKTSKAHLAAKFKPCHPSQPEGERDESSMGLEEALERRQSASLAQARNQSCSYRFARPFNSRCEKSFPSLA
jgi:hypothetical protein